MTVRGPWGDAAQDLRTPADEERGVPRSFDDMNEDQQAFAATVPHWDRLDDEARRYAFRCRAYTEAVRVNPETPRAEEFYAARGETSPVESMTAVVGDDFRGYRFPVPREFNFDLMASLDEKWAVLESIGIPRRDETTPLKAWRDAVADETGVPRAQLDPDQGGYLDMGFTPIYVRNFAHFLA